MFFLHSLLRGVVLAALVLAFGSSGASASYFSRVVIDPGHGGHDRGGWSGKVYEKHLALDTALRLERYLQASGYQVTMTRKSDTFISLPRRAAIGNRYRSSILVSLHYNHTWRRSVSGLETFYYRAESKPLAEAIQQGMLRRVKASNRGVKFGRYHVLRASRNPAVLVECGFVSNTRERSRMKKGTYRDAVARGIAEGIANYRRSR
ncbi:MAG: N-acetylmuramoyl-L-alanine amidase [Roseibacillus sp.]|jgi:N-acetylmuramoyl-L-alanine amidase|nr:N-acetylmuramoyl-L-alanine amidase [Roseibacillus sp.]MCP4730860.1 N-acetylmuramoyl-L-alanine amidase [Roseibacillus sp.]MDP7654841.1 N-acetylmuramoyl-L-alanine amidase [Roseibacillus sp.]HJM65493.1 N-acetylmuramoyl-L-alanine amidase [Roseibacillus sp.]|tara:strand:- start:12175 stop:12792 length:618 start_codon:yes stop_codon:yes gene_type:complete